MPEATWTECVDLTGKTCSQLCGERHEVCTTCMTSRGYAGWGAEAWRAGQSCAGPGAGQTHCDFAADADPGGRSGPRWKCCCAALANMRARPLCHDNDDASGGKTEGGIEPHSGKLFDEAEGGVFLYSEQAGRGTGCADTPCRAGKPWDRFYNNSGINPKTKGQVWGTDADGTTFRRDDACKTSRILVEFYCSNYFAGGSLLRSKQIRCDKGCRDGACRQ